MAAELKSSSSMVDSWIPYCSCPRFSHVPGVHSRVGNFTGEAKPAGSKGSSVPRQMLLPGMPIHYWKVAMAQWEFFLPITSPLLMTQTRVEGYC